jgi:hypothetical protein
LREPAPSLDGHHDKRRLLAVAEDERIVVAQHLTKLGQAAPAADFRCTIKPIAVAVEGDNLRLGPVLTSIARANSQIRDRAGVDCQSGEKVVPR